MQDLGVKQPGYLVIQSNLYISITSEYGGYAFMEVLCTSNMVDETMLNYPESPESSSQPPIYVGMIELGTRYIVGNLGQR